MKIQHEDTGYITEIPDNRPIPRRWYKILEKESKLRSAVKSIIWRITGIIILAAITFIFTKSWIQTGLVTILHHSMALIGFYLHERIWLRINVKSMFRRSVMKMIFYETFFGTIILGSITYLVTGDLRKMSSITISYIGIKHICYVINEYVWRYRA